MGYSANTVTAEQWLDLLQASYNFQLLPLLETCETTLLSIVNRQNNVFKRIKASQLLEKCLELRLNAPNISPEDLVAEIDEVSTPITTIGHNETHLFLFDQISERGKT